MKEEGEFYVSEFELSSNFTSTQCSESNKLLLYHGGVKTIRLEDIRLPGLREDCDFGQGFYLSQNKDTAEEWVRNKKPPIINVYEYISDPDDEVHLRGYDWLRVILAFRENLYTVTFTKNVIIGAIADDAMQIVLPVFMRGGLTGLSDTILIKCLNYCRLGDQYVFTKHLKTLTFLESYQMDPTQIQAARSRYKEKKRGMKEDLIKIRGLHSTSDKYIEDYMEENIRELVF